MAAKETAVAVAPDRSRQSALVGTIKEKIDAFEQIAANLASLQLNGWKTMTMAKAACWLADGAGMHPAIFMQNHYCMEIKGRLLVEPKWEFIVGVLQARVPGFKFEVLIETDDCAEVRMVGGGQDHTVRYDLNDAKRQGLLGRDNAWSGGNTREMLFKQAAKRCGRRVGAAALMDLPVGLGEYEIIPNADATSAPSAAQAIDNAIKDATNTATDVPFEEIPAEGTPEPPLETPAETPASEPPVEDIAALRERLHIAITKVYGRLNKATLALKVNLLYNAMVLKRTGVDPGEKAVKLGPEEIRNLIAFLDEWQENKGRVVEEPVAEAPPAAEEDVAPAAETEEAPPSQRERTAQDAYDELHVTVGRARTLFGRKFLQESPEGSGKWWYTDQATFRQVGDKGPTKILDGGRVVAPIAKLDHLNGVLAAACDERERGGR